MFVNVLRAQQTKGLRSGVFWVEASLLAALTALMVVLTNTMSELSSDAPVTLAGQLGDMLKQTSASSMGHMLVVVLAGSLMAHEYSRRSLHLWLSRGVSRPTFLWTKFVSLLAPIALFMLVTVAVTAPIAAGFTYAEHGTVGPLSAELGGLVWTTVLGTYALIPYAALALFLAVVGRSMLVAVGGSLAFTLVAETLLAQLLNLFGGRAVDAIAYLPSGLAASVVGLDSGSLYTPVEPGTAAVLIAGYTLVFLVAATLVFRRQDLSA